MKPSRPSVALAGLIGAALLIYSAPARAAVELLSNPGFEANVNGSPDATTGGDKVTGSGGPWTGWNNWTPPYNAYYTAAVAHTGAQAGKSYSGPNAGIYQAITGTAGDSYTASGWFDYRSTDAMGPTSTEDVRIIFQDAGGNALAGGTFPSATFTAASGPADTWTQRSVTAVAPAGTAKVEIMAFFNNPNNEGGAMYVDDMSLTDAGPAPEPASLGLLSLGAVALLARRRRRVTA